MTKKNLFFVLGFLLSFTFATQAQVVTSKKEAVKKGIYQKPAATPAAASEPAKQVATTTSEEPVKKVSAKTVARTETKPAAKTVQKSKKSLIKQTDDADLISDEEGSGSYLSLQMVNNALSFIGTRYLGGGTSTKGMDCSGMVTAVFNIFDMNLPRSSHEMAKIGVKVAKEDIKKGDLIFFHTNGKSIINHVGMVIEVLGDEIKFVHSSTSKGVIVSSTKEAYYQRNFVQANRVL